MKLYQKFTLAFAILLTISSSTPCHADATGANPPDLDPPNQVKFLNDPEVCYVDFLGCIGQAKTPDQMWACVEEYQDCVNASEVVFPENKGEPEFFAPPEGIDGNGSLVE